MTGKVAVSLQPSTVAGPEDRAVCLQSIHHDGDPAFYAGCPSLVSKPHQCTRPCPHSDPLSASSPIRGGGTPARWVLTHHSLFCWPENTVEEAWVFLMYLVQCWELQHHLRCCHPHSQQWSPVQNSSRRNPGAAMTFCCTDYCSL